MFFQGQYNLIYGKIIFIYATIMCEPAKLSWRSIHMRWLRLQLELIKIVSKKHWVK